MVWQIYEGMRLLLRRWESVPLPKTITHIIKEEQTMACKGSKGGKKSGRKGKSGCKK